MIQRASSWRRLGAEQLGTRDHIVYIPRWLRGQTVTMGLIENERHEETVVVFLVITLATLRR